MRPLKNNNKKEKQNKKNGWFFVTALIVFFTVYISISFALTFRDALTTTIVKKGNSEELISSSGYIFKDSVVVASTEAGYIDCLFDDDEKVKKGEPIISVYDNEVDIDLKSEIAEVSEKIETIKETILYKTSESEDENKAEQRIAEEIKKVSKLSDKKNIEEISQIKKNINSILLRRTANSENQVDMEELKNLEAKLSELKSRQNSIAYTIYAPQSGTFISKVDGSEDLMSLSALEKNGIDYKLFKEISKFKPNTKVVTKVGKNEPVGKIVDNFSWVIAAEIPVKKSELFNIGDKIYMRFPDSEDNLLEGKITQISGEEGGKVIVCIKSNKYSKTVYRSHKTNVELIKCTYSGIMVPRQALRIIDNVKGVYVLKGDIAKFIPIDIVYSDDRWLCVRQSEQEGSLMLYDEVILKGRDLYNGKVVR